MKKTLLNTLFLLIVSVSAYSQQTSRLIPIQATPYQTSPAPDNILSSRLEVGDWRIYNYAINTFRWRPYQVLLLADTIRSIGDVRYQPLGSYLTTEVDPTVPSYAKSLSAFSVIKASTDALYRPIGYVPSWTEVTGKPSFSTVATSGDYNDLINKPTIPTNTNQLTNGAGFINQSGARSAITLTTTGTSGNATYNSTSGVLNIPNYTPSTYTAGTGISIASNVVTNTAPDQTVTITGGSGIQVTGTYPNFVITNTYKPTVNIAPGRSLNSNFTPSASRPTLGIYTVTCSTTNPLLVGTSSATVTAEYSTNGGGSWNPISLNGSSNGVGITVTVALTVGQISTLVVPITEGWLVRLRTSTSGTANVVLTEQKELNL